MSKIAVCLKQYIDEEDCRRINELENACIEKEDIFLKLELEFKLNMSRLHSKEPLEYINEFFYYCGEVLIGYLGIFSFGGETGELTGMVHPLYRRKGIFTRLYTLAMEECSRRNFTKILLVCDNRSSSGLSFIKAAGRIESMPEEDEKRNIFTYMIELNTKAIGKIRLEINDNNGFISGFGILPGYRNKGYGRQALKTALYILNEKGIHSVGLEVASDNKNALGLYKSCGFTEESVTDYFCPIH